MKKSFDDFIYKASVNGECNRDCQERASAFLKKIRSTYTPEQVIVIVSHGNLIATLLNLSSGNEFFVYDQMMALTNPDIFMLKLSEGDDDKVLASHQRIWDPLRGLDIKTIISARAIILDQSMSKYFFFFFMTNPFFLMEFFVLSLYGLLPVVVLKIMRIKRIAWKGNWKRNWY